MTDAMDVVDIPPGVEGGVRELAMPAPISPDAGPFTDEAQLQAEMPLHDDQSVVQADSEGAREVAAQHFARMLYQPTSDWSRYVFHENDPHPYGRIRPWRH